MLEDGRVCKGIWDLGSGKFCIAFGVLPSLSSSKSRSKGYSKQYQRLVFPFFHGVFVLTPIEYYNSSILVFVHPSSATAQTFNPPFLYPTDDQKQPYLPRRSLHDKKETVYLPSESTKVFPI
jgi:hypothetical protein